VSAVLLLAEIVSAVNTFLRSHVGQKCISCVFRPAVSGINHFPRAIWDDDVITMPQSESERCTFFQGRFLFPCRMCNLGLILQNMFQYTVKYRSIERNRQIRVKLKQPSYSSDHVSVAFYACLLKLPCYERCLG
jgi:hypothetical protein